MKKEIQTNNSKSPLDLVNEFIDQVGLNDTKMDINILQPCNRKNMEIL